MQPCEKCIELSRRFRISTPSDLKQAIRIAKQNVADSTILEIESEKGQWCEPFSMVSPESGWDDIMLYVFSCDACGKRFQLSAETYHGAGGEWKPL